MATATTASPSRAEIFRQGLKDATGTITYWRGKWGTITLDGFVPIEYHVHASNFTEEDLAGIRKNSRVIFSVKPGETDMMAISLPEGTQRFKAPVSSARLMNFNR